MKCFFNGSLKIRIDPVYTSQRTVVRRKGCYTEISFSQVRSRLVKMGLLNSINIFLRQEIARMQKVLTLVRITLTDLKLAIEGTIIMSEVTSRTFLAGNPVYLFSHGAYY